MGDTYQFLLGADVLRGAKGLVDEVAVITGSRVEWSDTRNNMKMVTPLDNPVGPTVIVGVSAAAPPPPPEAAPKLPTWMEAGTTVA